MLLMAAGAAIGGMSIRLGLGLSALIVVAALLGSAWIITALYLISEPRR